MFGEYWGPLIKMLVESFWRRSGTVENMLQQRVRFKGVRYN